MNEESLFDRALSLPAAERHAFLDRECANDAALRQRVEALLSAHEASANPLDRPPEEQTGAYTPQPGGGTAEFESKTESGILIAGRYTLEQKLGEGGMGEVWVAKQTEPVKRRVALKLIKAGMDSKAVLQRFDQERQALAMMDHPNIARVLDGGLTDNRHPYFVMELVNGLPLTKFCDEAKLTPRQRLELFVPICHAVQHAHQKGIVHRDLKPANILVTMIDGRPVPKVIDFGVAKATAGKLTAESLSTQFGAVIGTLEYMSPEQAGFSGQDIDTRSDIYSLGVVLYELLTGLRPIDAKRLKKAALSEMIRIIQEDEPSKPSTRLSTDESLPSLAAIRQTEPKRLMALLRGELDWVVMKCLEKQRDRRYESANGLARDIQRFLADEPVEARPPSAGYRMSKFLRRNKGPVVAATLVLIALVAGIIGTTWGLFEARNQAEFAKKETAEKEIARAAEAERAIGERKAKEQAQNRLRQIEKANALLTSIFATLDPKAIAESGRPLQAILVEKLDHAIAQLDGEVVDDPEVLAQMQTVFGLSLLGLGEPKRASIVFERARSSREKILGPVHEDTLKSLNNLAHGYQRAGRMTESRTLYDELLRRLTSIGADDGELAIEAKANLASWHSELGEGDKALPIYLEVLRKLTAARGPEHEQTMAAKNNLALAYVAADQCAQATPLLEDVVKWMAAKRSSDHPETLIATINLGCALIGQGDASRGLQLLEALREKTRKTLDREHPVNILLLNNLGTGYRRAHRLHDAVVQLEEALRLNKAKLGDSHPNTISMTGNLGDAHLRLGQLDKSLPLLEEAVRQIKLRVAAGNQDQLQFLDELAQCHLQLGRSQRAVELYEEALTARKDKLGPNHASTLSLMSSLGSAYFDAGRSSDAQTTAADALNRVRTHLPPELPATLKCKSTLGTLYWKLRKFDISIPLFEETLAAWEKTAGKAHMATRKAMANLSVNYVDRGQHAKALPLLEELVPLVKANPSAISDFGIEDAGRMLAKCYQVQSQSAKAEATLEETAHAILAMPANTPRQLQGLTEIGVGYWKQRRLNKSIPIFEAVLKRRKALLGSDHPETIMAIGNLGVNYKDAGRLKEAIPLLEECMAKSKNAADKQMVRPQLMEAYARAGENYKAAMMIKEQLPEARLALPKDSPQLARMLAIVAMGLLEKKQWVEAEGHIRESLGIYEKAQPDFWMTLSVKSMLGGALMGQKKYTDAEPLLLSSYEGMKKQEAKIPPQAKLLLTEAIERLVQLYEATSKKDEAAKWRKELEARKPASQPK